MTVFRGNERKYVTHIPGLKLTLIKRTDLRDEGLVLQNNGLSVKILPRFKGFMVDYFGGEHSDSAVFWHGDKQDKDTSVLQTYWKVQENNTVFPKCELIHGGTIG